MNKPKIVLGLVGILAAGTVFAETPLVEKIEETINLGIDVIFDFEELINEEEFLLDDILIDEIVDADIDKKVINTYTQYIGIDEIAYIAETINTDELNKDEMIELRKIIEFEEKYHMDDDNKIFINNMISNGKNPQLIMYIYEFWLATNEDISIIEELYDMFVENYDEDLRLPSNKDLWFEGLFYSITGGKCGKLTREEIEEYLQGDISIDDITMAEYFSRTGTDVHDILSEKLSNRSWSDIAASIYHIPALENHDDLSNENILDILTLSRISDTNIVDVIENIENVSAGEVLKREFNAGKMRADNALIAAGYWYFDNDEEEQIVKEAINNGSEPFAALMGITNNDETQIDLNMDEEVAAQ